MIIVRVISVWSMALALMCSTGEAFAAQLTVEEQSKVVVHIYGRVYSQAQDGNGEYLKNMEYELADGDVDSWGRAGCSAETKFFYTFINGEKTQWIYTRTNTNGRTGYSQGDGQYTPVTYVTMESEVTCQRGGGAHHFFGRIKVWPSFRGDDVGLEEIYGQWDIAARGEAHVDISDQLDFGTIPAGESKTLQLIQTWKNKTNRSLTMTINGQKLFEAGQSHTVTVKGEHGELVINGYTAKYVANGNAGKENLILNVALTLP